MKTKKQLAEELITTFEVGFIENFYSISFYSHCNIRLQGIATTETIDECINFFGIPYFNSNVKSLEFTKIIDETVFEIVLTSIDSDRLK